MAKFEKIKKILILLIILLPSIFFNYFTLQIFDHDNKLSFFSTFTIFSFNLVNILFGYIFYRYGKKNFLVFFLSSFIFIAVVDFSLEIILNKKSFLQFDKELGWVLRAKKKSLF